jgi:hypothetical protein
MGISTKDTESSQDCDFAKGDWFEDAYIHTCKGPELRVVKVEIEKYESERDFLKMRLMDLTKEQDRLKNAST